ncbi:eCIS core domain-containing protein [Haliscomenobacter sp.]|uniref:eCIS core domain-containing protein n=1 Tax=Haliscomenobacter sp. TaxID=2717303 RepID=UPI003BAB7E7D
MKSIFHSTLRSRRAKPQPQHEAQAESPSAFFQPKLTINAPNDQYEREADAVADQVVNEQSSNAAGLNGQATIQRKPISQIQRLATPAEEKMPATNDARMAEDKMIQEKPEIQRMDAPKEEEKPVQKMDAPKEEEKPVQKMDAPKEEEKPIQKADEKEELQAKEEKEEPLQAKSQGGTSQASPNFSSRLSARKGQGSALPKNTQTQMEQGIGADFSQVRIHTDSEAANMNKEISAQAFTHGQDVYFNQGKFSPGSAEGQRLLAHELTHVVQQGGTVQRQAIPDASSPQAARTFAFSSNSQTFSRFDVTYTPVGPSPEMGRLDVTMRVHFTFRGAFNEAERQRYTSDFENSIETAWSNQHELVLNDSNMDPHRCQVYINVVTVDDPANAHFRATVAQRRSNFRSNVDEDRVALGQHDANDSTETRVSIADLFKRIGDFDFDSAAINTDVQSDLDELVAFLNGVPASIRSAGDIWINYTGLASSEGNMNYNRRLAERRINTVQGHIQSAFPDLIAIESTNPQGEANTEADAKYRRVDVSIDLPNTIEPDTTRQNTAAHEAGHMFGLGDEYIEEGRGNHRFEGDKPSHYNMVRDNIGLDAAEELRVGNNESIMSHGMNVHRGHYILFMAAIRRVSGNDHWTVD